MQDEIQQAGRQAIYNTSIFYYGLHFCYLRIEQKAYLVAISSIYGNLVQSETLFLVNGI